MTNEIKKLQQHKRILQAFVNNQHELTIDDVLDELSDKDLMFLAQKASTRLSMRHNDHG